MSRESRSESVVGKQKNKEQKTWKTKAVKEASKQRSKKNASKTQAMKFTILFD